MNYNYVNGLIILDSYYTAIEFRLSNNYFIVKYPDKRLIVINFIKGMKSSDIYHYEMVEDVELSAGLTLLDNNYIIINNNYYYCKQKFEYISHYVTDFLGNKIIVKDNTHLIIAITPNIGIEGYKKLLSKYMITNNSDYLFNCSYMKINKCNNWLMDTQVYSRKRDVYISSIDARNAFIDAITKATGIQVVTTIDQRILEKNQLLEYFQLSDGIATTKDSLNTRIIFDSNYGRLRNNSLNLKLNYYTKDIALYERRLHEFLLKNDLNRITTFKIYNKWSVSVDWEYETLPNKVTYNDLKLDDFSKSTMLYSLSFQVKLLFFIVEKNIDYPKILDYLCTIIVKDKKK